MESLAELVDASRPQLLLLLRVAGAVLLGGLIGAEREVARKPAGLRARVFVETVLLRRGET